MIRSETTCTENIKTLFLLVLLTTSVVDMAVAETSNESKRLYEAACTQCHGLRPIEYTRDGRNGWEDTVHKMVIAGAQLNVEEMELVIDYLSLQFGPSGDNQMRTGNLPEDSALQSDDKVSSEDILLPEGDGSLLVQAYCSMCHDLGRIVATRRDKGDWHSYTVNMLAQNGIKLNQDEIKIMVSYLTNNFGKLELK